MKANTELQQRAYKALLLTMSQPKEPWPKKPRNQWHEKILAQTSQAPATQKVWHEPIAPCRGYEYDWPDNAI